MSSRLLIREGPHFRRGVVAVQVAVVLVVIIGFTALTIDLGAMYNTKGDLQRATDAATLAAAGKLSDWTDGNPLNAARQAAMDYVAQNPVLGRTLTLDSGDIVFGRVSLNENGGYDLTPTELLPDAVQVTLRHTGDSPNGAVPLYFARIFGRDSTEMETRAVAIMVPRDIFIAADLSGSMNDDSEMRDYKTKEQTNIFEVWDDFPGGVGDVGSSWDPADMPPEWFLPDGNAPQASGPGWGYFKELGWGNDVTTEYRPETDPGLVELRYNSYWSNNQIIATLYEKGYSNDEVNAIMTQTYDTAGAYGNRVAIALGLATWDSGIPGGRWETLSLPAPHGNGNGWMGDSELAWNEAILGSSPSESGAIWHEYIDGYMKGTYSMLYQANSRFRYRFGFKTFVNYLLERRPSHEQTPEFADTRAQPMQAVKNAVNFMSEYIDTLDTDDRLGLGTYDDFSRLETALTHNHSEVTGRLDDIQAAYYATFTNMGGGLEIAIQELTGNGTSSFRPAAKKMIVLMTDGRPNVSQDGELGDYTAGAEYTLALAQAAADQGITIFAVSVGYDADQSLMQQIADIGGGEHFHAEGSVDEYSAELVAIFQQVGGTRPVELIE